MFDSRYYDLIDEVESQALKQDIFVAYQEDCPPEMPAVSSVEKRMIIIPEHFLHETKETAFMICHEIAHIAHHDNYDRYRYDGKQLYMCEHSADIGGLYYLIDSYMDVYDIDDYNDIEVNKAIKQFNLDRSHFKYIQQIGRFHIMDIESPLCTINHIYHNFYKVGKMSLTKFEFLKLEILECVSNQEITSLE